MKRKKPESNREVLALLQELGFDGEFAEGITALLDTDFLSERMLRFLKNARPRREEQIADQLVAIWSDREKYVQKHIDEYYRREKPVSELFLREFTVNWKKIGEDSYIRRIPAISGMETIRFHQNITLLTGENGSGKSTVLEALAIALGLNPEGGTLNYRFNTYHDESELGRFIRLKRGSVKPMWSYFLRAESFFNVATAAKVQYESDTVNAPDYHAKSHGESFLDFIQENASEGLYLMDEPESALSPQRQLTLLLFLYRMAREGSQFIIATHSPILLGIPDAEILSFDGDLRSVEYEETESYKITKMFIEDRKRVLHRLLSEEQE